MFELRRLKNTDFWLLTLIIILSLIGAMNVFSTTFFPDKKPSSLFINQLVFYFVGFILFLFISIIDVQILKKRIIIIAIYIFTILSLVLVLFAGTTRFGAQRWISFGTFDFQPSELTKIALIILVSFILSNFRQNKKAESKLGINKSKPKSKSKKIQKEYKFKIFNQINTKYKLYLNKLSKKLNHDLEEINYAKLLYLSLLLGSFGFLIEQQNSLGNLILLILIFIFLVLATVKVNIRVLSYFVVLCLFINTAFIFISFGEEFILKIKYNDLVFQMDLLVLLISIFASIIIFWKLRLNLLIVIALFILILPSRFILEYSYNNIIEPYQRGRIESFVNPQKDQASSWNRKQSVIAVGSGRFAGKGFLKGTQSNYRFLPFSFTDFAFAALAEQFGQRGMFVLLSIYFLFFVRIYHISKNSKDRFASLVVYGVMCMLFFNFFQHIGMNIGILPITGVPLPLISYGGSYLISTFIGLGLAMAVNNNSNIRKSKVYRPRPRRY